MSAIDEELDDVTLAEPTDEELEGSNLRPEPPEGEAAAVADPDDDAGEEATRGGPTQPAKLSAAGATFISRFEGYRPHLYNDPVGHCTIGIGHLVHHGNCNGSEPGEFRHGIDHRRAYQLLLQDCAPVAAAIHGHIHVALNQAQFDALVSWGMNNGAGVLATSTLTRKLNQGNYDAVPAELMKWNKAGSPLHPVAGLTRRRRAEGELFAHGHYA
jgi:GH24 family phage-related lysozyme (muramidase)